MTELTIELEDDPVPIVKIMAARFRRATGDPDFDRALASIRGTFALKSVNDPQAVTVSASSSGLRLDRGVSSDAAIVIHIDFEHDRIKRVEGLLRHPLMAFRLSRLMKDRPVDWQIAARDFWERARSLPGMPAGIDVRSSDDGRSLGLGEPGDEPAVEIEAHATALAAVFSGEAIIADAAMKGQITIAASMKHLTILSEATKKHLLGEL